VVLDITIRVSGPNVAGMSGPAKKMDLHLVHKCVSRDMVEDVVDVKEPHCVTEGDADGG
jgi:hypothetical protein